MPEGLPKSCPSCGRSYGSDAKVCAYDETPLAATSPTESEWTEQAKTRELEIGDLLGPYRIADRIGEGGMGVIYRAKHLRIGREVALKVLRSSLIQQTDIIRRFFQEARTVNEIRHPNIVDIVDLVEDFSANPPVVFMVMELLCGTNLNDHLRNVGALQGDETITIALQIADALKAAHDALILHRDVKPENIFLVSRVGQQPLVKLLDFGVVKAFGQREPSTDLTRSGVLIGTPEYMAPEHALDQKLDERTDVYSLGLVMYEMLAGATPFRAEGYVEVLMRQVQEAAKPVSSLAPSPVAPDLEAAIMRCLEKRPQDRFQNMRELQEALRNCSAAPTITSHEQASAPLEVSVRPGRFDDQAITEPRMTRASSLTALMNRLAQRRHTAVVLALAAILLTGAAIILALL